MLTVLTPSSGLGGALGYILGGLDWTGTALGQAFKAQEQVLFLFSAIIFIVSVVLHMISIPEQPLVPSNGPAAGAEDSTRNSFFKDVGHVPPLLDVIKEEDGVAPLAQEENDSIYEDVETNFLSVDRVRSKSDSVLAMPDSAIELDSDLDPDSQLFLPDCQEELEDVFKPQEHSVGSLSPSGGLPPLAEGTLFSEAANSAAPEPNSHLQRNAASNDSCQKTQVQSRSDTSVTLLTSFPCRSKFISGGLDFFLSSESQGSERCFLVWLRPLQSRERSRRQQSPESAVQRLRHFTAALAHLLQTGRETFAASSRVCRPFSLKAAALKTTMVSLSGSPPLPFPTTEEWDGSAAGDDAARR